MGRARPVWWVFVAECGTAGVCGGVGYSVGNGPIQGLHQITIRAANDQRVTVSGPVGTGSGSASGQ
jgi:hypothetical protein